MMLFAVAVGTDGIISCLMINDNYDLLSLAGTRPVGDVGQTFVVREVRSAAVGTAFSITWLVIWNSSSTLRGGTVQNRVR